MIQHRLGLVLILVLLPGCGGRDKMAVYPVSGTVMFDGEPMKGGGAISFIPTGGQKGKAPGGEINDSGEYILDTYSAGDGAIAGEFRVAISQVTLDEPEATPDGTAPRMEIKALPAKYHIPAVYSDFNKSPLKATVETKKNQIDFELKREPAAIAAQPGSPNAD